MGERLPCGRLATTRRSGGWWHPVAGDQQPVSKAVMKAS